MQTREELITLCELALVSQDKWHDRDSERSQAHIGKCWALLKAGCEFRPSTEAPCITDEKTIWIEVISKGFDYFEVGNLKKNTFYLPTLKRLQQCKGGDWY